jgi:hypothetical protein
MAQANHRAPVIFLIFLSHLYQKEVLGKLEIYSSKVSPFAICQIKAMLKSFSSCSFAWTSSLAFFLEVCIHCLVPLGLAVKF